MKNRYLLNILVSIGVSLLLLGLLLHSLTGSAELAIIPRLVSILTSTSLLCIGLYLLTGCTQSWLRAMRYRVILRSSLADEEVPGHFHLFLVTLARNMFVDMLPARLGELSYIAMLNRGFKIGADACLSSLAISFVFDLIALALLLLGLMGYQLLYADLRPWLISTIIILLLVCTAILVFLFPFLRWFSGRLSALHERVSLHNKWLNKRLQGLLQLIEDTTASLQKTRQAGITGKLLALSLGVRIMKYLGLYLLFLGVVLPSALDIEREISSVLIALVSAEAGASMPVPAFMSFGTYEAGGVLALVALGASKTTSVLVMLALHIWSQLIDYSLGISGLILFIFVVSKRTAASREEKKGKFRIRFVLAALLPIIGLLFFALQLRDIKKMGSFRPPKPGKPVLNSVLQRPDQPILTELRGFVIWSSNRSGNHDLLMLTLPEQQLTRLTSDPHTEYFPRISPDGSKVVYCRSQVPWVSQRNYFGWDVYLLDLASGASSLLAKNGKTPTWSVDGKKVFFQRQGNQVVQYSLADREESILFASGKNILQDSGIILETPVLSPSQQSLAVTLRGRARGTFIGNAEVPFKQIGGGCQLNWSPDGTFLYRVDHGGRGGNSFYQTNPLTMEEKLWYDAPGEYSHEYFPKLDPAGEYLVFGASAGGHEHDTADYEIFLWKVGSPMETTSRLSFHTGNDNWPDIFVY